MECDCKISWITEWIKEFDLQVTSRERDPQFCGAPERLKERSFYQLSPKDLGCIIPEEPTPPSERESVLGDVVVPPTRRPEKTPPSTFRRRPSPNRVRNTTQRPTTTPKTTTTTTSTTTKQPPRVNGFILTG